MVCSLLLTYLLTEEKYTLNYLCPNSQHFHPVVSSHLQPVKLSNIMCWKTKWYESLDLNTSRKKAVEIDIYIKNENIGCISCQLHFNSVFTESTFVNPVTSTHSFWLNTFQKLQVLYIYVFSWRVFMVILMYFFTITVQFKLLFLRSLKVPFYLWLLSSVL